MNIKITATGRHYIGNDATLEEFIGSGGIVDRTRSVLGKTNQNFTVHHRLRVNYDSRFGNDGFFELRQLGNKLMVKGIDFNVQLDMGPGSSFRDGLLYRDAEVTMLYGADQIHIDKNLECFAELAERMLRGDKALGGAARPNRILLSDVPQSDLIRQIHEVYHMLAAGAKEGKMPDNPFNFDTSKGSPLFVGINGKGGLGDLTGGLAALNHTASRSQHVCEALADMAYLANSRDFTTEYGLFISEGLDNIEMIYMNFSENRFYRDKSKLTQEDVIKDIEARKESVRNYASQLNRIPYVRSKLINVIEDPATLEIIRRNVKYYDIENPESYVDLVTTIMREELLLDEK